MNERVDAIKKFEEIRKIRNDIANRFNKLNCDMGRLDKKLVDIAHILEFFDFNASELCKLSKMQTNILRERREIKCELEELSELHSVLSNSCFKDDDSKVQKNIEKKVDLRINNKRNYRVRAMTDLFGKNINENSAKPSI